MIKYRYDSYGKLIGKEKAEELIVTTYNPYIYKGYYYDEETGLYYCNTRYYSPEIGRFISPDDIEYLEPESINGLNLYMYCGNDPVNMYDPSGNFAISALIIGRLLGLQSVLVE